MAALRYMLDTNMASYIIRGPGSALAARLVAVPMTQFCVSSITEGELLYGLARRPGAAGLQTAVQEFPARLDVLPGTVGRQRTTGRCAPSWKRRERRSATWIR